VAAWLVVLTHCLRLAESLGIAAPGWWRWLDLGTFAVYVFFCLSGFTLALAHGGDRWDVRGWARFLTRRLWRIYPSFLASFLVCLALVALLQPELPPGTWIGDGNRLPDLAAGLAQLSLTANVVGVDAYVNNVFWSLPIEFQFYLLFPPLLMLLRRSAWAMAAAVAGLAIAGRGWHWPGQTADLAWIFAAGMLAGRRFAVRGREAGRLVPCLVIAAALAPATLISNLPHAAMRGLPGPLSLYLGACAIAIVVATAQLRWPWRALIGQGEISYSIYLFHTPAILLTFWLAHYLAWTSALAIDAIVVPVTWVSAMVIHRLVERPGIAFGRRLASRI